MRQVYRIVHDTPGPHVSCSTPHELIRLKCDYPSQRDLESSRTSNGSILRAVRHPCGTLINYIFQDRVSIGNPHETWAESYNNHIRVLRKRKRTEFKVLQQVHK